MITKFKLYDNPSQTEIMEYFYNDFFNINHLKDILDKINFDFKTDSDKTILMQWVDQPDRNDIYDGVKILLDAGALKTINYVEKSNDSALMFISYQLSRKENINKYKKNYLKTIYLLIDNDANWNFVNKYDDMDFLGYLGNKKDLIINKYPEKYKKYLREKRAKKFKI